MLKTLLTKTLLVAMGEKNETDDGLKVGYSTRLKPLNMYLQELNGEFCGNFLISFQVSQVSCLVWF